VMGMGPAVAVDRFPAGENPETAVVRPHPAGQDPGERRQQQQ
jgi:hypothetical protein